LVAHGIVVPHRTGQEVLKTVRAAVAEGLGLLSGAENAYGFGLSAALVVPMGSAGEAGW
jgi:hypothetical protein